MTLRTVQSFILEQFNDRRSQAELKALGPPRIDWQRRTRDTIDWALPRLYRAAPKLKEHLEWTYNAVDHLAEQLDYTFEYDGALHVIKELIQNVESNHVSAQVQSFLADRLKLHMNGANSYPDLFRRDFSYDSLCRGRMGQEGPYLSRFASLPLRPNKAPDGIEVKASKDYRLSIMAHHAHPGLHVCVKYDPFTEGPFVVRDVLVGFFARHTYQICGRYTEAETPKVRLNEEHFISVLHR